MAFVRSSKQACCLWWPLGTRASTWMPGQPTPPPRGEPHWLPLHAGRAMHASVRCTSGQSMAHRHVRRSSGRPHVCSECWAWAGLAGPRLDHCPVCGLFRTLLHPWCHLVPDALHTHPTTPPRPLQDAKHPGCWLLWHHRPGLQVLQHRAQHSAPAGARGADPEHNVQQLVRRADRGDGCLRALILMLPSCLALLHAQAAAEAACAVPDPPPAKTLQVWPHGWHLHGLPLGGRRSSTFAQRCAEVSWPSRHAGRRRQRKCLHKLHHDALGCVVGAFFSRHQLPNEHR